MTLQAMSDGLLHEPAKLDEIEISELLFQQFTKHSRTSEDLFKLFPELAADDHIRVLVLWTEYKCRLSTPLALSTELSAVPSCGTGELDSGELDALIARFPQDAEALREQFQFERTFVEESNAPHFDRDWQGDRFEMVEKTGQGWFCAVYLANDLELGRKVAVKVPHPGTLLSLVERFRTEARSLAKLKHPNIVTVFDFQPTQSSCLLICEYIADAQELAAVMKDGRLSVRRKAYWMEQIASALAHAHENGIVHRDLKPTNILVVGKHAWLNDFGLSSDRSSLPRDVAMQVGSPGYMSPEQMAGELVTEKVDIYGLGVVLRELFGVRPPRRIGRLIERMLAKEPRRRPTAADCAKKLAAYRTFSQKILTLVGVLGLLMLGMLVQWRVSTLVRDLETDVAQEQLNQVLDEYLFMSSETGADLRTARLYPRSAELSARIARQRARLEQLKTGISGQWPKSHRASDAILLAEAEMLVADGRARQAIALLEPKEPSSDLRLHAMYFQIMGEAYFQESNWSKTLECFQRLRKVAAPPIAFIAIAARSAISMDQYDRALDILNQKVDNNSQSSSGLEHEAQLAMLTMCRATVYRLKGNLEKSEKHYGEAIAKLEAMSQRFNDADYELALCYYGLASLRLRCDNGQVAVEDLKKCQSLLETIIKRDGRQDAVYLLVNTLTAHSQVQRLFLDPQSALEYSKRAVELLETRKDLDPKQVKLELPIAVTERGSALATIGKYHAGQDDLQRAVRLFQDIADPSYDSILATALANQGYVLHELNQSEPNAKWDAIAPLNQAIEILESLNHAGRMNFQRKLELARAYMNRGCAHIPNGKPDEFAAIDLSKAEQLYVEVSLSTGVRDGILKNGLIVCRMNLASALKKTDRSRCLQIFEQVVESLRQDKSTQGRTNLALAYLNRGIARMASVSGENAKSEAHISIQDMDWAVDLYGELISEGQVQLKPDRERCTVVKNVLVNAFGQ